MGFGSIGMIWTLAIPAIVLLYYFFRKKYEELQIPSVMFWEESRKHTEISPLLQHLHKNALFYLQMAALLLFVFLLLKPYITQEEEAAKHLIIVADTSATMFAEEEGEPLIERHRERMARLVREHPESEITLIRAGETPELLLPGSHDTREAIRIIDSIEITYGREGMPQTLSFAETAAKDGQADIHVFTDSVGQEELPPIEPGIVYHIHAAESVPDNVSVDHFGIAREGDSLSAIAVIFNHAASEKSMVLSLHDENGKTVGESMELTIPPDAEENVRFDGLPLSGALSLTMETDDGFNPDNSGYAVAGGQTLPVFADAGLHELVHKALQATGSDVTAYGSGEAASLPAEAIVITGSEEMFRSRSGRTLLFGRDGIKPSEKPAFTSKSNDPLFTFAPSEDIYLTGLYPPFEGFVTVAEAEGGPFIQRSEDGRIAVLADPSMTDWPLRPSFPLFLWSVIDGYSREQAGAGSFLPGESRTISSSAEGGWQLFTADGEYKAEFGQEEPVTAPDEPGLYVLRSGSELRYLTVVLPEEERQPTAGPSFTMGEKGPDGEKKQSSEEMLVGIPLIFLILMLLIAEWEVQRRHGLSY